MLLERGLLKSKWRSVIVWLLLIAGLFILIIVFTSMKTLSLNDDEAQKERLKEIIESFNKFMNDDIDGRQHVNNLSHSISRSKNKSHLASMVKTYSTMNLNKDDGEVLYRSVKNLL